MHTNHQIIDWFPIPAFIIDKNNFKIIYYNNKALILSQLNEGSIKNYKLNDFIDIEFLKVGEFENCSYKTNEQSYLKGNLIVQAINKEELIVSFSNDNKTIDNNTANEEIRNDFHFTKPLIDFSLDSIFIIEKGIIKYANPSLLQVSGYALPELIGKKFTEFVSTGEREKVFLFFNNRKKGEHAPVKYESIAKLKNGEFIDVEVSVGNINFEQNPAYKVVLRDITKRKIAERKYRNIVDFAPIGYYQSSRDGDFLLVNNEMANILGFENKEELVSRNIKEFYYSIGERERLIEKYDTSNKSEVKNAEVKFRKKDGSPIWILMTSKAIKDECLNTISYDGFIIDISDRKRKENVQTLLLKFSESSFSNISLKEYLELIHKELKQIMQADNFYVALYDKGTDKYSFPYSVDPYDDDDYDSPVYLHQSLTNIVRETKQAKLVIKKKIKELLDQQKVKAYGEISAVWLGVPIIDSSKDEAIGVLAIQDYKDENAYDIEDFNTMKIVASNLGLFIERVRNQEKLRKAKIAAEEGENKLKFLADSLEQVGECVSITDKKNIILYVNHAFCSTYGYTKDELLGENISLLQNADTTQSQVKDILSETERGNWKGELINKRKDGTLFPILLSTSVIEDSKQNQIAFTGIAIDITEIKKTRNELFAAKEKAEESDRLKSAFLANMSHEIRTPMNGIMGFSNLLLEPELSDETKDAYIKIILQSGERMLNTVSDLVEISKIEAGIVVVKNSLINVNKSVENILSFFKPQAEEKGLILSFESDIQETNFFINSDKNKYESILTNLIRNAIKYTQKGSIKISNRFENGFLEFCINDTGIGVPEHRKKAIFNCFEQADIEDTKVFEGSGLGLAISKSYVEMLGGEIWLESIEGEGSQFYFKISCVLLEKETTSSSKEEIANNKLYFQGQLKILIVEDDESSALFLKAILKDIAQKIYHAKTGEQAINEFKSNVDYNLILMDIKMPGIDGFETAKRIRKFNKEVVIIAQTAYAMIGDKEKAISAGCNDYIAKPIIKIDMLEKIEKNIKKHVTMSHLSS